MFDFIGAFMKRHSALSAFVDKLLKDNVGLLASVVSWTLLTSIVPVTVGLIAISGLLLRDAKNQAEVVSHLSQALQGVLSPSDLNGFVRLTVEHTGLFGIIGFVGVFWGGSNVGGAISTVFQPIFQVRGRSFLHEKLIDVGMIFVFTSLLLVILAATTASTMLNRLVSNFPLSGESSFIIGTLISLTAAFLLFTIIYLVFPNVEPRFKIWNVWSGAAIAAVLFQTLTFIWPLYARFAHFQRYSAVIFPLIVLGAWLYFFSLIMLFGAEIVSFRALREAEAEGRYLGPRPDGTVPQRIGVIPEQRPSPPARAKG